MLERVAREEVWLFEGVDGGDQNPRTKTPLGLILEAKMDEGGDSYKSMNLFHITR